MALQPTQHDRKDACDRIFSKSVLAAAWPIMAGYVVLGLPCGILAASAGLDLAMVAILSLLFYSGAGQYMIPNMWLAGAPVSAIVVSVSLVNSRQMLYAASLSRYLGGAGRRLTLLFAATVTDESFGVNLGRFQAADSTWTLRQATGVNLCALVSWAISCMAGVLAGHLLSLPVALASFAMTSIFICLLCTQRFNAAAVAAAAVAAVVVVVLKAFGLSGPAIPLGALAGIAAGMLMRLRACKSAATGSAGEAQGSPAADARDRDGGRL